jgi:hypothetical protein
MDPATTFNPTGDDIFLSTTFQYDMENAVNYYYLPSDETRPFDNKYESRKILETLLTKVREAKLSEENQNIANGIVNYYLGVNYFETEETHQGDVFLSKSLNIFKEIKQETMVYYLHYVQDLYNQLGCIYSNRDDTNTGLGLFAKAQELYEIIIPIQQRHP